MSGGGGKMKEPRSAGVSFAPLQVAGAAPRFALDDDEEQLVSAEESRLLFDDSTPHGDGDGGVADGGAAKRARLARSVSTFTLKMEEQESWAAYRHEAGRCVVTCMPCMYAWGACRRARLITMLPPHRSPCLAPSSVRPAE